MTFESFGKIPRLSREIAVTEKLDGTNAQVYIASAYELLGGAEVKFNGHVPPNSIKTFETEGGDIALFAGSRSRFVTPGDDNFGFAKWVGEHAEELVAGLGIGRHYGEWWGQGIQRGYGLKEKRFSLFNTHRWAETRPACCDIVPVLMEGLFDTNAVIGCVELLKWRGSTAAPGFMQPEGVIIYHKAANFLFKKTIEKDQEHKGAA